MTGELRDYSYAVDAAFGAVPPTRIVPVHGTRGTEPPPQQRRRLGEALVDAGVLTQDQLDHALNVQRGTTPRRRLGSVVVDLGLATDVDIARGLAANLGFEYVEPAACDVPLAAVQRLPRQTADVLCAVPIAAGDSWVRVAVADPTDRYTLEALREATGLLNVSLAVATPRAIEEALDRFWAEDYAPAVTTPAPAPPPPVRKEEPPAPVPKPAGPQWQYAFVGDALPTDHPGYTADHAAMERELTRLGALGWEAVGVTSAGARMTVLLKRSR